jgi:ATP-dependent helicase HrpA
VSEPAVSELHTRLDGLTVRDAARLGRRLKNLRGATPDKLQSIAEQLGTARPISEQRINRAIDAFGL